MKIAFVSSGSSIHVKKIANGLTERGHEIVLYTLPNHKKLISEFDKRIQIKTLPFGSKLGYYLNALFLNRWIKKGNFDLVNCHYVSGYGTLARISRVRPLVTAVFGSDVFIYPYKSRANKKRVIKNLDAAKVITSTSNVMADAVKSFYKSNREIYITPFGVNRDVFKPNDNENNNNLRFTFGIVKKLEDVYGIDILIRAFSDFLNRLDIKKRDNVCLSIYGFGSKEEEYKKLVKEKGIDQYVVFNGFIKNENVPSAFYRMDVACFPSLSESFGVAAIEAMACGIPVIVSDAPGFTEVVEKDVTGYVVPKNNIDALADKMFEVFNTDRSMLKSMGNRGSKRVERIYDFDGNIETYINAISKAIEVQIWN